MRITASVRIKVRASGMVRVKIVATARNKASKRIKACVGVTIRGTDY
jgi:hypothetical protein